MRLLPPTWRRFQGIRVVVLAWLVLLLLATPPVQADTLPAAEHFRCDGDPLTLRVHPGAVDAPSVPNSSAGTVPGAFLALDWRDHHLQLPRTNNAGPPSFTDGQWWWSQDDPEHPRFLLRGGRGEVQEFLCTRLG